MARKAKRPTRAARRPPRTKDPLASGRLSPLLRSVARKPVVPQTPAAAVDPLAELLSNTEPLVGSRRVPLTPQDEPRGPRRVPSTGAELHFVVEVSGALVQGFRADLGPGAVGPLRRVDWVPEERIDLHGKRAHALAVALRRVVRECATRGVRRLLVIHGKGLHSKSGAGVLGELTREALVEAGLAPFVRAFRTASALLGGEGALVVELERPAKR
ncbi:MAG TPA: Smr/MutS family protein [Polyangiaceae bacterium]|nr:Smr/MutS family protein [Polyangiaceae bacterium]